MNTETPVTEADLHAYVDGQLSPSRRRQVEAWLAEHPRVARELEDYRVLGENLHRYYDPVLQEPLPPRLRNLSRRGRVRQVAAALAWIAVGVVLAWAWRGTVPYPGEQRVRAELARPAAFAYSVYTTDRERPVEIRAAEEQRLIDWLSERMHTELRAPNLATFGYELIGGRLLPSTNRMAAQFMYQGPQGGRITLYVRRITGVRAEPLFRYAREAGVGTFYWVDGPMGYALSGELDKEALLKLAEAVYGQLSGA